MLQSWRELRRFKSSAGIDCFLTHRLRVEVQLPTPPSLACMPLNTVRRIAL